MWGIASPHLVVLWYCRLEASAEFQAWRKVHGDHYVDDKHVSAKHIVLLLATVAAVLGAGRLLMCAPRGGGPSTGVDSVAGDAYSGYVDDHTVLVEQHAAHQELLGGGEDDSGSSMVQDDMQAFIPNLSSFPTMFVPHASGAAFAVVHPTAWYDAAWQAMLLMVVVVGISTACSLAARLLRRWRWGQSLPAMDIGTTCPGDGGTIPAAAGGVLVEVPIRDGMGKPEPLYGQVLILQAELAKKARELQTASARCMELDAAVDVLRDENRDLQQQATRSLEAKVCVLWGLGVGGWGGLLWG